MVTRCEEYTDSSQPYQAINASEPVEQMGPSQVLPYIANILKSAVFVGTRKIENGVTSYVLANALKYQGKRFIIIMVVNEDAHGKKYYDHEFTTIKKIDALPAVDRKNAGHTEAGQKHQSLVSILHEDVWSVNASQVVDTAVS